MKKSLLAAAIVISLSLSTNALAQKHTFAVDPSASNIAFSLSGTGHDVEGTFHVTSGEIHFDPSSHSLSGSIVVSAASGQSGNDSRDKKMHNDVLDVSHFADVTFQPQSYQGTIAPSGDSSIQVSGQFTLHGTPHPITVPMQLHIDAGKITAKGSFMVPYVKWGLKNPSIFILKVAKEVKIDLNLAGTDTVGK
ncbi:MAG: YceI family protein [Acidobacteriota bacterium]|nr:YceI family protein [Acidobacteriota bacterium]